MISEKLRGITFARHWVPLANISPNLPLAVIASEDGRFCDHWGVDWSAVKEAVEAADDFSDFRGASTIPMQTVKNLYLWSQRNYVRKALDDPPGGNSARGGTTQSNSPQSRKAEL